jgi:hypothetical protein
VIGGYQRFTHEYALNTSDDCEVPWVTRNGKNIALLRLVIGLKYGCPSCGLRSVDTRMPSTREAQYIPRTHVHSKICSKEKTRRAPWLIRNVCDASRIKEPFHVRCWLWAKSFVWNWVPLKAHYQSRRILLFPPPALSKRGGISIRTLFADASSFDDCKRLRRMPFSRVGDLFESGGSQQSFVSYSSLRCLT